MPDRLFEYAVIRLVPRVDREEFINVGVILYCAQQKFLRVKYELKEEKLRAFSDTLDMAVLKEHLQSFERICIGGKEGGTIGKLPIAERFRWLTAVRSSMVQTSRVHPGLCSDAAETLERLYDQLVG